MIDSSNAPRMICHYIRRLYIRNGKQKVNIKELIYEIVTAIEVTVMKCNTVG